MLTIPAKKNLLFFLCLIVPVSLQIQLNLFSTPTYLGLRINLADALVPFAGLGILFSLLLKKTLWPKWCMKKTPIWLLSLSIALVLAYVHTYVLFSVLSHWALLNKLGGWGVLLCLFAMGSWVGFNAKKEDIQNFIYIFVVFFGLVLSAQISMSIFQVFEFFKDYVGNYKYVGYQISGFMANRNAFAFTAITAYVLATEFYLSQEKFLPQRLVYLLFALLPGFVLFNASRAGLIAFFIVLFGLFLIHREQKEKIVRLLSISILFTGLFAFIFSGHARVIPLLATTPTEIFEAAATNKTVAEMNESVKYHGDKIRLTILEDTLEMIKDRPVFGSGLGSIMILQQEKHGRLINLMDSTPLWLWAETGLAGLLLFAVFYLKVVHALWKSLEDSDDFEKSIRRSILFIILGFSIMCLLHEIMYTRHLWFLLGLGLSLPSRRHHPV